MGRLEGKVALITGGASRCSTAVASSGSWTAANCPATSRGPGHDVCGTRSGHLDPGVPRRGVRGRGQRNYLDIRNPEEYREEVLAPAHLPQEQAQRPGHIASAVNVPWSRTTNGDGTCKSDQEIAAIYAEAGIDWNRGTIANCRIGERSSHSWFAIHELLGHANSKNYGGSWTEYGSIVGVPIALGDRP